MEWIFLMFTAWLASTISGIAGFGGSLIILPVFSHLIGVKKAIPVLTIAWMMGNLSRAAFGYQEIQWKPVLYFCLGAVPAAIVGSMVFVELPAKLVMKAIGVFLVLILALRHSPVKWSIPERSFVWCGIVVGFLSSIFGSAGSLGAVAFLSLNLSPTAYVASEAVTAVAMHLTKTAVYGRYDLLTGIDVWQAIGLGLAMVAGSWTSRQWLKKMSGKWFMRFVDILLVAAALSLFL